MIEADRTAVSSGDYIEVTLDFRNEKHLKKILNELNDFLSYLCKIWSLLSLKKRCLNYEITYLCRCKLVI